MSKKKTCFEIGKRLGKTFDARVLSVIHQSRNKLLKQAISAFGGMVDFRSQGVCSAVAMTWIQYCLHGKQDAFIAEIEGDMAPILMCQLTCEDARRRMLERHAALRSTQALDKALGAVADYIRPIQERFVTKRVGPTSDEILEFGRLKAKSEHCRSALQEQEQALLRESEDFIACHILEDAHAVRDVDFFFSSHPGWDTLRASVHAAVQNHWDFYCYIGMSGAGHRGRRNHAFAFYIGQDEEPASFIDANACLFVFPDPVSMVRFLSAYWIAAYELEFDTFQMYRIAAHRSR